MAGESKEPYKPPTLKGGGELEVKGMPRTDHKIDRDEFHKWLWDHTDARGRLKLTQREIAEKLSIGPQTPSRLMQELIAAGKLKKRKSRWLVKEPV